MKLLCVLLLLVFVELGSGIAGKRMCMPTHPQTMFCKADYAIRIKVVSKVKEEFWAFETAPSAPPTTLPRTTLLPSVTQSVTSPVTPSKTPSLASSVKPSEAPSVTPSEEPITNISDVIDVQKDTADYNYAAAERPAGHMVRYQDVRVDRILKGKAFIKKYSKNVKNQKKPIVRVYLNQIELLDSSALIVGKVMMNKLWVSSCDWYAPWKTLTSNQKKGLKKYYRINCGCDVMTSFNSRDRYKSSKLGCYWVPDMTPPLSDDCGYQHQYCHMNKRGYCEMTMKSYLKCVNKKEP